jgi:hypothetical protein
MINSALSQYMLRQREPLEQTLRRVVREDLANYAVTPSSEQANDDPS